jgi:hypothetical protein
MEYNKTDVNEALLKGEEYSDEELEAKPMKEGEKEAEMLRTYPMSHGLTTEQAEGLLAKYGKKRIARKDHS